MNELEIFEKLKEALNYRYLVTEFGGKEVTNLEEYIEAIRYEREFENSLIEDEKSVVNTYDEFIKYLHDKAIGNIDYIIEAFDDSSYRRFEGYKEVIKEIIDKKLYLIFEVDDVKLKAEWQAADNYAVWQRCGIAGDDYYGYLLFPTHEPDNYFCLYFRC